MSIDDILGPLQIGKGTRLRSSMRWSISLASLARIGFVLTIGLAVFFI